LESELILAAEIRPADQGDSQTLVDSVLKAQENLQGAEIETEIEEAAADKGYHAAETIELADALGLRTYIPEPKRKDERVWSDKPAELKRAVYENRRRMKRAKGKRFGRLRSERVERSFAHVCDSGGMRRSWLKGVIDVTKRYLIAAAAHNLGRILRKLFGIGKPKTLQGGYVAETLAALVYLLGIALRACGAAIVEVRRRMLADLAPKMRTVAA
jgi:hypothetical protein